MKETEWEHFHVCMAMGKRTAEKEPGARVSCRLLGETNVLP